MGVLEDIVGMRETLNLLGPCSALIPTLVISLGLYDILHASFQLVPTLSFAVTMVTSRGIVAGAEIA